MFAPRTGVPVSASTTLPTAPGACVYVQVQPPVRKHMRNKSSLERLSEVIIGTAQHFHHFLVGRLWEAVIITPYRVELGINKEHQRSEEHTSELQSHSDLVCRLLLEKKK